VAKSEFELDVGRSQSALTGNAEHLGEIVEGALVAGVDVDFRAHAGAQRTLGIPNGSIKATVLIETLPAAFEMD
jgi:hypothetical protein